MKLSEGQQEQVKKLRSEGLTFKEIAAKIKELYQIKVSLTSLQLLCPFVKIDGRGRRGRGRKVKSQRAGTNCRPPSTGVDKEITAILQEITDLISDIKSRHLEELKKIRKDLLEA